MGFVSPHGNACLCFSVCHSRLQPPTHGLGRSGSTEGSRDARTHFTFVCRHKEVTRSAQVHTDHDESKQNYSHDTDLQMSNKRQFLF